VDEVGSLDVRTSFITTRILPFAVGIISLPLAYYVRTWDSLSTVRRICPRLFCDFSDYYYPMGEVIFQTHLPIDGYLYSPFIAILLAIFPPLGLDASLVLWGVLQVVFVSLYVHVFRRLVPAGLTVQLIFITLVLTSQPLLLNLMGGQVSVFIIGGILGTLALYERDRRAAAAGSLAFAVSFKFYPILFIAPFAARRDARFVLFAIGAGIAFLLVVPGVLLGPADTLRFYGGLVDQFRDSGWVATNPHSQFLPHVVLRFTGATDAQLPLLHVISYAVAAANMGLVYLVQRGRLRHADLWSMQIVFLTIPFVLKTSWTHDFVFFSFTQAFLAWQLMEAKTAAPEIDTAQERPPERSTVTWTLLIASIVLSNIVFYNLVGDFTRYGSLSFHFWANLLLLIAIYVEVLPPALQRLREPV
jgi:hypothetical protein